MIVLQNKASQTTVGPEQAKTIFEKAFHPEDVVVDGRRMSHEVEEVELDAYLSAFDALPDAEGEPGKKSRAP